MLQLRLGGDCVAEEKPKKPSMRIPNLSQLSSPGIYMTGGVIDDTTIRDLRGGKAFKAYREMADHSAVIGACLLAIEMLLRRVNWTVEPGSADEAEVERAEIINGMRDDMSMSWADTVAEILSMLVYGFAWMEECYKVRRGPDEKDSRYKSKFSDGVVGWRKWVLVPQETLQEWKFDEHGGVQALVQSGPPDFKRVEIPISKSLLFRTKVARNNPQGRSMLMNAYFPWQFVKRIQEFEAIGIERDLAGIPVAEVPPEYLDPEASISDKAVLAELKKLVTSIRQNSHAGIIFPRAFDDENNELFKLHLLATGGMKQFDTGKVIERYERRMAMSLLADMIMMGHERSGSFALSRDKTTTLGRALNGIITSIAEVINRHAIPRLYQINGWPTDKMSKFIPGDVENADLKTLGVFVRNLASVGLLTPDADLENSLREVGGLPKIDPDSWVGPQAVAAPGDDPEDPDEKDDEEAEDDKDDDKEDEKEDPAEPADPEEPKKKPAKKPSKTRKGAYAALVAAASRRLAA